MPTVGNNLHSGVYTERQPVVEYGNGNDDYWQKDIKHIPVGECSNCIIDIAIYGIEHQISNTEPCHSQHEKAESHDDVALYPCTAADNGAKDKQ